MFLCIQINPLVPKGSPFDELKASGVRHSKIYKSLLGITGLRENLMIHLSFTCNPQKVHVVGCPKAKGLKRRKLFLEIANKYMHM